MGEDAARQGHRLAGVGRDRRERLPFLATFVLAWAVVTGPVTYAALILSSRECAFRAGYALAAAAAALLVLLLGGWAVLASDRWQPKLAGWLALLAPPGVSLLIGYGCNFLWW
jgi:hypothetical protein